MSYFSKVNQLPADPILGLVTLYNADSNPLKVNLGIGVYRNEYGSPHILKSVLAAEYLIQQKELYKEYLPIDGNPLLNKMGQELIFGKEQPLLSSGELLSVQTVGGTGALRIGGEFLSDLSGKLIYIPNPSWPNHRQVFEKIGFKVKTYTYYDKKTNGLDFSGFCESIKKMPKGSVILLHGCCHNPTGNDPSQEQWEELSNLIKKQEILPFFDVAYQGFGKNLDADAYGVRYFASQNHEMLVALSFAKNFGIYNDRIGLLVVRIRNKELIAPIRSQVLHLIRSNYSSPPNHGAQIVTHILASRELRSNWITELESMRDRISKMRKILAEHLGEPSLLEQKGLFSFLKLRKDQVLKLRKERGIYILENGRINVAGLNETNIDYVVKSIKVVQ